MHWPSWALADACVAVQDQGHRSGKKPGIYSHECCRLCLLLPRCRTKFTALWQAARHEQPEVLPTMLAAAWMQTKFTPSWQAARHGQPEVLPTVPAAAWVQDDDHCSVASSQA